MRTIPYNERNITDEDVFSAFDLNYPGLERVRTALEAGKQRKAKEELVRYFETRSNVRYYYDYRQLPLTPIETDSNPYLFQSSMGLQGSLKDFCLFAGRRMMEHVFVRPGKERRELDLGTSYEKLLHLYSRADESKGNGGIIHIFQRGVFMESLSILYHETGDPGIINFTEEFLHVFWENYPLIVTCTDPKTAYFSMSEVRNVMDAGFLAVNYITLLYTRLPYEMGTETAFELIKHLWFLGMQFRRFDVDTYRKYNHHLWERGLVPFILGTLFPEIPDFAEMRERGAKIIRLHILDDFNEEGGYNEHSIPYWCGAALGEMVCRGIHLARLNKDALSDGEIRERISKSFDILASISAPGDCYPSLGDNGGSQINPVLQAGAAAVENRLCEKLVKCRLSGGAQTDPEVPLDYCNDRTGFFSSKSSLRPDANYVLMSVKINSSDTGHNHMDLLSAFVSIHGQEIIGEPYARTLYHTVSEGSDLRGYLYNMESHNTVLAFGMPIQPDFIYSAKWGVIRPDTPVETFIAEKQGCYVKAYHDGYTHSRHVRKILSCRQRGFLIRDELIGGNRVDKESIQRWHLFPDVKCEQMDAHTLLIEKNGAKALLVWSGKPRLRLWQKQELYPDIVKNKEDIATIVDVCFKPDSFTPFGRIESLSQDLLILDVTEGIPAVENVDELCSTLMKNAEEGRLSEALERFDRLK